MSTVVIPQHVPNTVELEWLENLRDYENMLETGIDRANEFLNSARSGGIIGISSFFFNMKVCCVFCLESPHRGDSNEYTQNTIFSNSEIHPKLS